MADIVMGFSPISEFLDDISVTRSGARIATSEQRPGQSPRVRL
jgi:hypothetical protein